jgi:hypothetical protein
MTKTNFDKKTRKIYKLLLFSLIFLFNPNINIIDLLPDFVAYFILYLLLEKPSDTAAYFEEVRASVLKLCYVSISKIPALFLVYLIRGSNTNDTDIFALVTLIYLILELVFLIPAITNLFEALFHLGERTQASALIRPFRVFGFDVKPELLRVLTYAFAITKSALFFLPELLILTSSNEFGTNVSKYARYYPYALLIAQIIIIAFAIVLLVLSRKYILEIIREGNFNSSLEYMQTEEGRERYSRRVKARRIKSALTLLAASSFFSIDLVFSNFENINLLPRFIYGIAVLYALKKLYVHSQKSKLAIGFGIGYTACAFFAYASSFYFLNNFNYSDLLTDAEAVAAYTPVLITALIESLALVLFLVFAARSLRSFVKLNTGLISPESDPESPHIKEYHRSIIKRIYLMFAFAAISGIAKCVHVFLNKDVSVVITNPGQIGSSSYVASTLPWFNLVVFATTALYIGYSLYFISCLKEEIDLKHETVL